MPSECEQRGFPTRESSTSHHSYLYQTQRNICSISLSPCCAVSYRIVIYPWVSIYLSIYLPIYHTPRSHHHHHHLRPTIHVCTRIPPRFCIAVTSCTAQEGLDRASHAPRSYVSVNQVAPRRCNSIDRAAVLQNCDDDDERYTAASASNSSMMISNGIWYNNDAGSRV